MAACDELVAVQFAIGNMKDEALFYHWAGQKKLAMFLGVILTLEIT